MQVPSKKDQFNLNSSGRPYNFFGDYLRQKYNASVFKLPIDAGFTCPNKDGTLSRSGCVFCAGDGSGAPSVSISDDIIRQMENARDNFRRSGEVTKYIAYFQAFTNTYADIKKLKNLYDTSLKFPDVVGLMIATRPDCVPDDVLDLISSYIRDDFELCLEIGMQSIHERSLSYLNRGHSHRDTRDAVLRAGARKIPVCVHVILGIPGESWRDMMDTADEISDLPVSGVKIHHLHVIRGTKLEEIYNNGEVHILDYKEYVSTVCDFMERLKPDILIHRLLGDRSADLIVAPGWALNKGTVLNSIEEEFARRCTWQGFLIDKKY